MALFCFFVCTLDADICYGMIILWQLHFYPLKDPKILTGRSYIQFASTHASVLATEKITVFCSALILCGLELWIYFLSMFWVSVINWHNPDLIQYMPNLNFIRGSEADFDSICYDFGTYSKYWRNSLKEKQLQLNSSLLLSYNSDQPPYVLMVDLIHVHTTPSQSQSLQNPEYYIFFITSMKKKIAGV